MIFENKAGFLEDQPLASSPATRQRCDNATTLTLNASDLLRQAVDLLRMEENQAAIKLLKKACELDVSNAQLHAFLGAALAEELQIDQAQAELDLALELNGQDSFVQLKAGELMLLLGRTPEALQHLEKAFKLPAPSPETRFYIVTLLRQTRQNSKKLIPRENKLVGAGGFKTVKALLTRARNKRPFGIQSPLPEQNRGEI